MGRIRLKDIAEKVDMSSAAVSKVLNNRPIRISDAKRRRILEVARELDYRPNVVARALKAKGTKSVGVVVPSMRTLFFPELIEAIENLLFAEGYQTFACNTDDRAGRERRHLNDLANRQVDGLVISPAVGGENTDLLRTIQAQGIPVIFFDRRPEAEDFPFVATDNYAAARQGVRYLVEQGAQRIVYLGDTARSVAIDDRLTGARNAAEQCHVAFSDHSVFPSDFDRKSIRETVAGLLGAGVGIFLETGLLLMGVLDAVAEAGLSVPKDVLVVGFDAFRPCLRLDADIRALGALNRPPASLRQDSERIAHHVVEFLLATDAERANRTWQTKVPAQLLVR